MGETFYAIILQLFASTNNMHEDPHRIVSGVLSNGSLAVSYFAITLTLLWLTYKSMLLRRTTVIYLFAAFIFLCGVGHLGQLIGGYELRVQLVLDFLSGTVSVLTAIVFFQKRQFILSIIYQFKYVVGLLKTLELDDDDGGKK